MAQITGEISLDVAQKNVFQPITTKQNDSNSRFLKITVTDNGKPLTIMSTSTVLVNALRSDGESKSFAGSVNSDGTVTVPLTNWTLALDGEVRCDVTVIDSDNRKLTTTLFSLMVERAANPDGSITEADDYDVLVKLIGDCNDATTAANTAAQVANTAAQAATNAVKNIPTKVSQLENDKRYIENTGTDIDEYRKVIKIGSSGLYMLSLEAYEIDIVGNTSGSFHITNLSDPSSPSDAATKGYVDDKIASAVTSALNTAV